MNAKLTAMVHVTGDRPPLVMSAEDLDIEIHAGRVVFVNADGEHSVLVEDLLTVEIRRAPWYRRLLRRSQ